MSTAHFEITTDAVGHGSVVINGEDVSRRVSGVAVVAEAGQATVVTLRHVGGTAEISGEGIVRVQGDADGIAGFLDGIDAQALEAEVLARLGGFGAASSTMGAVLDVLKEWARGG